MQQLRYDITRFLQGLPSWQMTLGSIVGLFIIGGIDYAITVDLGFSIFYVLPITVIAWYIHPKAGYLASCLSAVLWFIAEADRTPSVSINSYLLWNTLVRLTFWLLVVFLLAKLKASYSEVQRLASTDFLTGLLNRRAFMEDLEQEILRSKRYSFPFTLAYLDVDNFKQVNDRSGHAAGDLVLQAIAHTLNETLRATDITARLGGDEFAILMPQTKLSEADTVLSRLFQELSHLPSATVHIGFSIGAVTFLTAPESADQALVRADRLMYTVKAKGKNQFVQTVYEAP